MGSKASQCEVEGGGEVGDAATEDRFGVGACIQAKGAPAVDLQLVGSSGKSKSSSDIVSVSSSQRGLIADWTRSWELDQTSRATRRLCNLVTSETMSLTTVQCIRTPISIGV